MRPNLADIKRHVVLWLNVRADPDTINDADLLVWTKGRWGTEIQPYATIFLKALHLHHLDFDGMMKYKGADGTQESAIEVLLSR